MLKALLVDDEILTIRMLQNLINWEKYHIELVGYARDGESAYEKYIQYSPDIIITDIKMPKMTGLELITKVREVNQETEFIIISAYADFDYIKQALKMGCVDYILKPIDELELEGVLKKIVEKITGKIEQKQIIMKSEFQTRKIELCNFMKTGTAYNYIKKNKKAFKIDSQNYRVIIIHLNQQSMNEYTSISNLESLQMSYIMNIFEVILARFKENIIFNFENASWTILLSNQNVEQVVQLVNQIINSIYENFNLHVMACFSDTQGDLSALPAAYDKTKLLCRYSFYVDSDNILGYGYNCKEDEFNQVHFLDLMKEMVKALKEKDKKSAENILNEVIELSQKINPEELNLIYEFYYQCILTIRNIMYSKEAIEKVPEILNISFEKLKEQKSIKDLRFYMFRVIEETLCAYDTCKVQYIDTIQESIKILEDNYSTNISLDDICTDVSVSKNYFCYLFKREVGISVWNYLTNLRIMKAKELLLETNMKSYEIAFLVGYDNPSYFAKVFKRYEAMTPNEYKEHKKNNIVS